MPPSMSDVMNAIADLQAVVIRMETSQKQQAAQIAATDTRVSEIESVYKKAPWKLIGLIGSAVGLLLIPTITTLITVGRRDEALRQTVEAAQETRRDVHQIAEHVEELSRDAAVQRERNQHQDEQIRDLTETVRQPPATNRRR